MGATARTGPPEVLVVGGAVGGLAAAEALGNEASVTLFEREYYDEKRVNCGEAINDARLVPLERTPANGFLNDVDGFQLEIYPSTDRPPGSDPLAKSTLWCDPGYICDRNVVERRWARRLEQRGVDVREGEALTIPEYRELLGEYDYVVDATGQPSLTLRAFDLVDRYTGDMVALNADVEGDFHGYETLPRIVFEGYVGYAWSFPKSATRANVGIGWAGEERPEDYFATFRRACERAGFPVPERAATNIYTIPKGPSLAPEFLAFEDEGIFLVGDAAGIANRYQGEGICQAIRSAYLLGELLTAGRESAYPAHLYALMRAEYRLAHLLRGAWMEFRDPTLIAALARAIDGLTIEQVTRAPAAVYRRILRHPTLATRMLANPGMLRRCVDAYTDSWEYPA